MSILHELMQLVDPGTSGNKKLPYVRAGEIIKDVDIKLSNERTLSISSIVKNGSLLLVFIRGTWCPFCRVHMTRLRKWANDLKDSKSTIIVVSSESTEKIRAWLDENPFPYFFASDEKSELADMFGVRHPNKEFSQAATFLIDADLTVRLAYVGKRTKENFDIMKVVIHPD